MGGVASSFLAVPLIFLVTMAATGAGRRIAATLLPDSALSERSVLGFPIGMGLLSLLTTAVLFVKVPPAALFYGLIVVLLAALGWARRDVGELLVGLRGFVRESPLLAAAAGFAGVFGLAGCLAPETGVDTGVYHFTMARLRAEQGAMVMRLDVPFGFRPASMGMLHTLGFALNGETLASLINASFYFAGLALARLWGTQLGGARGGFYAGLAWLTPTLLVLRMDGGDVEVGQAVYLGTALFALSRLRGGGSAGWRVLAAGALGMLLGMKYAAVYAVVVLAAVWLVVRLIDRAGWRTIVLDAAVIGSVSLALACPWYVRNYLATESFVFPYQPKAISIVWAVDKSQSEGSVAKALLDAVWKDLFVLVGVAAVALPGGPRLRWAGIASILQGVWIQVKQGVTPVDVLNVWRYASQAWMPLLVLGGLAVAEAVQRGGTRRIVGLGLLGIALAIGQGYHAARNVRKIPAAIGLISRDAFLESRVSTYRAIRDAEAALAPDKKLLLVEERSYYCRAPFLEAGDIQQRVKFDQLKTVADVRLFLREESIGAIVVDRSPQAKTYRFQDLERRLGSSWPVPGVRRVDTRGAASLYLVD